MSITASTYKKKVLFLQKRAVLAVVERLVWQLGRTLVAVAVVERFKQEVMYGLSAGTKKSGRCREVAVNGGSTVFVGYFVRNKGRLTQISYLHVQIA